MRLLFQLARGKAETSPVRSAPPGSTEKLSLNPTSKFEGNEVDVFYPWPSESRSPA